MRQGSRSRMKLEARLPKRNHFCYPACASGSLHVPLLKIRPHGAIHTPTHYTTTGYPSAIIRGRIEDTTLLCTITPMGNQITTLLLTDATQQSRLYASPRPKVALPKHMSRCIQSWTRLSRQIASHVSFNWWWCEHSRALWQNRAKFFRAVMKPQTPSAN